ncbi:MAG TPA: hypothetical protein VMS21_05210 [Methylomirabilota bacterium]|nr:hypothetical protein [Methylomirabilota bacterium]
MTGLAAGLLTAMSPANAADDAGRQSPDVKWPQYPNNPFRFKVTIPLWSDDAYRNDKGGLVIHDVTGDGLMDYVISYKEGRQGEESGNAYIGAYDHYGNELWTKTIPDMRLNMKAEFKGLPGHFGPGFYIADINRDDKPELLHIDTANRLVIRDARSGETRQRGTVALPEGGGRWGGMVQVCNFRGKGSVDALLQAEYEDGDSRNAPDPHNPFHRVTAVKLDSYADGEFEVLWHNTDYIGGRHYGARAMDVDGDGRDEVCGAVIIDDNGQIAHDWRLPTSFGHYDSIKIHDARPDLPGLEIFLVTEGGNQWVGCVRAQGIVFRGDFENREPQKGIVGEFDPSRPGLESWWANKDNNSDRTYRFPFLFDSRGRLIGSYDFKSQFPPEGKERDWAPGGTTFIDWMGTPTQQGFMRGRFEHASLGGIANPVIFEPLTGHIVEWFDTPVRQCFPADVAGDYREEIVGIDGESGEVVVWWNPDPNPLSRERYWEHQWYRVAMRISDAYSVK